MKRIWPCGEETKELSKGNDCIITHVKEESKNIIARFFSGKQINPPFLHSPSYPDEDSTVGLAEGQYSKHPRHALTKLFFAVQASIFYNRFHVGSRRDGEIGSGFAQLST